MRKKIARASSEGFTLIELIVVITVLSVIAPAVIPRISNALGSGKGDMIAVTSIIAKTFDDAFLQRRLNFLAVHLASPPIKIPESKNELLERENGLSVLIQDDQGALKDSPKKILSYKKFPSSFRMEEVIFPTGEKFTGGTVLIPFYPEGYSENAIIHLTSGNDRWSVIIFKMRKEPRVVREFIDFDAVREGNFL